MRKISLIRMGALGCLVTLAAACGSSPGTAAPTRPMSPRGGGNAKVVLIGAGAPGPIPAAADLRTVAGGEQAFALALYGELAAKPGNLAIAPSSIATVLGMVAAGAKGATEQQLVDALRVPLPAAQLHAAIGGLVRTLVQRSGGGVTLSEVDQAWVQQSLPLLAGFTTALSRDYAAPIARVDFTDPTRAAATINGWVSDKTHAKIPTLISSDQLQKAMLVLTDAIYMHAQWEHGFDPKLTTDEPFHLGDGSTVSVPTMYQEASFASGQGPGLERCGAALPG